jgi:hypothetical protein
LSGSSPIPLTFHTVASTSQAGAPPSTGITRLHQYYGPLRLPRRPSPERDVRVAIPTPRISPVAHKPLSCMLLPLTPVDRTGASVDSSPSVGAFPEVGAGRRPQLRFRGLVGIYSLRPAESLDRPRRSLSRGFDPAVAHRQSLVSFRALSTSARLVSSSQWVYDRFRTHPTLRRRVPTEPEVQRGN